MSGTITAATPLSVVPDTISANAHFPPVDAAHYPDLLITTNGLTCWLVLAPDVAVAGNAPGTYEIPAGGGILIEGSAATATACSVVAMQRGGLLTFQRTNASWIINYPIQRK